MPAEPLPRVIDLRPARLPGGSRGTPFPGLPAGAAAFLWLANGSHMYALGAAEDAPADLGGVPWDLVDWWIPIGPPPAA